MKVSCIIPAFNEKRTIRQIIKSIKKVKGIDEIIVVDDGSTDSTYKYAKSIGVKIIKHGTNKGKGAAIKTGLTHSSGDIILFLDADITRLNHLKISKMINILRSKKAEVVIGTYNANCYQTFTELVYKPLMSLLFPEVISNIKCGHLSGERGFLKSVINRLQLRDGFDLETAMNIELTFMKPSPKIAFVSIGNLMLRPKGYQNSMEVIAYSIIGFAKKYNRINRLDSSSFVKVSKLLYDSVRSVKA